ncbi:MAG: FCD domain-containing protein, partial [Planctomycetota bacterium]|nr:FCD domain-containing protein [Planctomycetota bacterium]
GLPPAALADLRQRVPLQVPGDLALQTQQIRYVAWLDAARVQKSIREHRQILAALARRSTAAYEQALVTHLAGGKGDYQRIYPVGGGGERAHFKHGVRTARRRAARREEETHA